MDKHFRNEDGHEMVAQNEIQAAAFEAKDSKHLKANMIQSLLVK